MHYLDDKPWTATITIGTGDTGAQFLVADSVADKTLTMTTSFPTENQYAKLITSRNLSDIGAKTCGLVGRAVKTSNAEAITFASKGVLLFTAVGGDYWTHRLQSAFGTNRRAGAVSSASALDRGDGTWDVWNFLGNSMGVNNDWRDSWTFHAAGAAQGVTDQFAPYDRAGVILAFTPSGMTGDNVWDIELRFFYGD